MSTPFPDWATRDRSTVWHPYTRHGDPAELLAVAAARDAELTLKDGRVLIDAISSWWACLHGHGHPTLVEALHRQAARLDHVLFADTTHEPAVALAERLIGAAPPGLSRVFYSDDGSTAVEVALKLAYLDWMDRRPAAANATGPVFLALEHGYHGDTFGAMAVGDPDPFFTPFAPLFFRVERVPARAEAIVQAVHRHAASAAALIVEPLLQAAGGMLMHGPEVLQAARRACDETGVRLIADEVMTGFGRTGTLFACEQAGITPDFLCLAKGLTNGMLPLAVTMTTEALFQRFFARDRQTRFFAHGHTMTANPIACALAVASFDLGARSDVPRQLGHLGKLIESELAALRGHPRVRDVRRQGGVVAVELRTDAADEPGYGAAIGPRIRRAAVERGVLLRPLGHVLYAMPPACTTDAQALRIAQVMRELVTALESS